MKYSLLFLFISVLMSSCQKKMVQDPIHQVAIIMALSNVENTTAMVEKDVAKSGGRPQDVKVLQFSQKLESLRKKYISNKSKANLLAYTDTVLHYRQFFRAKRISKVEEQIILNKKNI